MPFEGADDRVLRVPDGDRLDDRARPARVVVDRSAGLQLV
jgi:hypothetical protein